MPWLWILSALLGSPLKWLGAARGANFLGEVADVDRCIDFDADMALYL
jgi:hypothetical protein